MGLATAAWKLETLELIDGRRLHGLVTDTDAPDSLSFVQVVRRPGRPLFLVTWGAIETRRIRSVTRLSTEDHATLAARVAAFRGQRDAAHAAETAVALSRSSEDGPWLYVGDWFTLESTMSPVLTREAVVRLEQVFQALESLVPRPHELRQAPPKELHVRLSGSGPEYRREQERLGIRVAHPAFYVPAHGLLIAGSEMPTTIDRERAAADGLELAERALADRDREFEAALRTLAADLDRLGTPTARRADMVTMARSRWDREKTEEHARIESARRDNAARVAAVRRLFYGWLAHEAWHAYADTVLACRLPVWLDEGLAQVIETAPLELGELRLDAPDAERLAELQRGLRDGRALPLADVLSSAEEPFGPAAGPASARMAYLMAWGLAFQLALVEPVLTPQALAAFGDGSNAARGSVADFEVLIGRPLDAFEPAWRRSMLGLRPADAVRSVPPAP